MVYSVRRLAYLLFLCVLVIGFSSNAFAGIFTPETEVKVKRSLDKTVSYLHDKYEKNDFKGILDWPAVGLWAAGEDLTGSRWSAPGDKNGLYWREQEIKSGNMFDSRATDYERTILGIIAGGGNPAGFAGKDLVSALKNAQLPSGKFADSIKGQGESLVNAHIWGIIALYAAGEDIPNAQKAYDWLAKHQNSDGGFSIDTSVDESDIDITAMSLIALAALDKDKNDPVVKKALEYLKANQQDDGNYYSWGTPTSESCAMVISGLIALGIDPASGDWIKNGSNPLTALLKYQLPDGAFAHVAGGKSNNMATQNALIALADFSNKKSVFTAMREKNRQPLFNDVDAGYWAYGAIKKLVAKNITSGYPDGSFKPEKEVSRSEFVKLVVLGLGYDKLVGQKTYKFKDLPTSHWANGFVRVAVDRKLVDGITADEFAPESCITGEQVMTILVRALGEKEAAQAAGPWYQGYVQAAREKGLLYPDFKVGTAATRAQCAYSIEKLQEMLD